MSNNNRSIDRVAASSYFAYDYFSLGYAYFSAGFFTCNKQEPLLDSFESNVPDGS